MEGYSGIKAEATEMPEIIPPGKTRITIRLDKDVIEWFRQQVELRGGGNYQTMINQALREHIHGRQAPLEELFRRVLREEIQKM
jgi:uncharacterized protein (DUF4415 family)